MSLIIILFIVMLVIFSILWGNRTFSVKTLNQMIYHMIVPCDGTDEGIFKDWFLNCTPPTFLTTLIGVFLLYKTPLVFLFDYQGICITILILGTLLYALINYQIITYVFDMVRTSKLYEEHSSYLFFDIGNKSGIPASCATIEALVHCVPSIV